MLGGGAVAGAIGGLVIGGVLGGIIGSRIGRGISWKDADYASDNSNADSVTTEQPSNVAYKAEADRSRNVWRLGVDSIEGGVDIHVHTGGSRDPTSAPPVNQGEASAAVTDMKGYYMRGNRGAWHTEGASHAHENHHFREWKDTCDHYWPAGQGFHRDRHRAACRPRQRERRDRRDARRARRRGRQDPGVSTTSPIATGSRSPTAPGGARMRQASACSTRPSAFHRRTLRVRRGWVVPAGDRRSEHRTALLPAVAALPFP